MAAKRIDQFVHASCNGPRYRDQRRPSSDLKSRFYHGPHFRPKNSEEFCRTKPKGYLHIHSRRRGVLSIVTEDVMPKNNPAKFQVNISTVNLTPNMPDTHTSSRSLEAQAAFKAFRDALTDMRVVLEENTGKIFPSGQPVASAATSTNNQGCYSMVEGCQAEVARHLVKNKRLFKNLWYTLRKNEFVNSPVTLQIRGEEEDADPLDAILDAASSMFYSHPFAVSTDFDEAAILHTLNRDGMTFKAYEQVMKEAGKTWVKERQPLRPTPLHRDQIDALRETEISLLELTWANVLENPLNIAIDLDPEVSLDSSTLEQTPHQTNY